MIALDCTACAHTHNIHCCKCVPSTCLIRNVLADVQLSNKSASRMCNKAFCCAAGYGLDDMCQAGYQAAMPIICQLLESVPSICTQASAAVDLQQQLPLKGLSCCCAVPTDLEGMPCIYSSNCRWEVELLSCSINRSYRCITSPPGTYDKMPQVSLTSLHS